MTVAELIDEDGMTDVTAEQADVPEKAGKKGLILGIILALVGAGGGYYLTSSGIMSSKEPEVSNAMPADAMEKEAKAQPDVVFVDLPPVIVSVNTGDSRHLKFHAQLEVKTGYEADVEKMKPRIMDVLNSYLRAVELSDLEDSLALVGIRGHLLRRIDIVVGEGRVRNVLVMEFVLN